MFSSWIFFYFTFCITEFERWRRQRRWQRQLRTIKNGTVAFAATRHTPQGFPLSLFFESSNVKCKMKQATCILFLNISIYFVFIFLGFVGVVIPRLAMCTSKMKAKSKKIFPVDSTNSSRFLFHFSSGLASPMWFMLFYWNSNKTKNYS